MENIEYLSSERINPLKTKFACFIRLSAYRAVNTPHLSYTRPFVNDLQGKSPYRTLKRNVSSM